MLCQWDVYSETEAKLKIIEAVKLFAVKVQEEVRQLLCLLTRDNPRSTEDLRTLLMDRISLTLRGHVASSDLPFAVRHEMALLAALVQKEDSCWEQKLRYK
jgi:E3 ubiquitin-protein ligase UBR4